jgi:hypothetical protein
LQKAVGGRPSKTKDHVGPSFQSKKERIERAGLTEKQAKNFQRLASVPQEIFDEELKHAPRPTTSGIIKAGTAPPLPFTSTACRFPPIPMMTKTPRPRMNWRGVFAFTGMVWG